MKYIKSINIFKKGEEYLEGEEFLKRAKEVSNLGDKEFEFYSKKENWKYLPQDADVLLFPNTEFRNSVGNRYVRSLFRCGSDWSRYYRWLNDRFDRDFLVASLASPLDLDSKVSELSHSVLCPSCGVKLTIQK